MVTHDVLASAEIAVVQARTVRTLMMSQVLGGVGVASGIAVGALVAADLGGRDAVSGLASTTQVLGGALATIPVAALMAARGRRIGLLAAYLTGTAGAAVAVSATVLGSFALLLVGTTLFGAATTANSQARYVAADLAEPEHRGRQLSLVVWATTVGAVLGPNLIGPGKRVAHTLDLPPLSGAWVFSTLGFVLAATVIVARLRPDPLLLARQLASSGPDTTPSSAAPNRSVATGLALIASNPAASWATASITTGHVVMVSVMVMTPLHMTHGQATIELIGLVISLHIFGMYGLSPVAGALTDRIGARGVVLVGVGLLSAACLLAGLSVSGWSFGLTVGLILLGLGWSCTMVAGSGHLTGAVSIENRPSVQGASDLVMGLSAAVGGALAGVVVQWWGFGWLCAAAGLAAVTLGAATVLGRARIRLS